MDFSVGPSDSVRRLLAAAAGRALQNERTEFDLEDLLLTLVTHADSAPLFAHFGLSEQAMAETIDRYRDPQDPAAA